MRGGLAGLRKMYDRSEMDARWLLVRLARIFREQHLEAVLIGNAAAALQGAPVTTLDVDFAFRNTAANVRRLKAVADTLGAAILRPYYPASGLYRLTRDSDGLQIDFMTKMHGIRSFESLRSRATAVDFDGNPLLVADLADIIKSKESAGRPQDLAVLDVLRRTRDEKAGNS
jgi:hypothetical protein